MSSGSPPSVSPALAGQSAKATIQSIAVRLITTPASVNNSASPNKLTGTVLGQDSAGVIQVDTDQGRVDLILKDRNALPKGLRIEIDIPAGRPQQANIRPAADSSRSQNLPSNLSAPSLTNTLSQTATVKPTLERASTLNPGTLETVLQSRQTITQEGRIAAAPPLQITRGSLELGQFVRLVPLDPQSPDIPPSLRTSVPIQDFLSGLIKTIHSLPSSEAAIRAELLTILSRIPLPPALLNSADSPQKNLIQTIQTLIQSIEIPKEITASDKGFSRGFNPTIPIDAQILGMVGKSSSPATSHAISLSLPTAPSSSLPFSFHPIGSASGGTTLPLPAITIAQIIGQTNNNLPILSFPVPASGFMQNYVMQFEAQNLFSSHIISSASTSLSGSQDTTTLPLFIALHPSSTPSPLNGSQTWLALQDLLMFLQMTEDTPHAGHISSAAHNMAAILPSPAQPQALGSLAMLFLSVLRSGDIESWIPQDALQMMRQATRGTHLLRNAAADLASANRMDGLPLPHDWRGVMIPLLWEQNIQKIPLYYKEMPNDDDDKNNQDRRRRLRFLFDLNLSRMGGVQVDGFLQDRRLDLVVRTKTPVSSPMQSRMKQLYSGAVEKSQLTGELAFQFKPEHWVDFSQPLRPSSDSIGVKV